MHVSWLFCEYLFASPPKKEEICAEEKNPMLTYARWHLWGALFFSAFGCFSPPAAVNIWTWWWGLPYQDAELGKYFDIDCERLSQCLCTTFSSFWDLSSLQKCNSSQWFVVSKINWIDFIFVEATKPASKRFKSFLSMVLSKRLAGCFGSRVLSYCRRCAANRRNDSTSLPAAPSDNLIWASSLLEDISRNYKYTRSPRAQHLQQGVSKISRNGHIWP